MPAFGRLEQIFVIELSGPQNCGLGGPLSKRDVPFIQSLEVSEEEGLGRGWERTFSCGQSEMFPWICTLRSRDVWRLLLVVGGILLLGARKELRSSLLMIYLRMVSIYTSFLGLKTLFESAA